MVCLKVRLKNGNVVSEVIGITCTETGVMLEREVANRHIPTEEVAEIQLVVL